MGSNEAVKHLMPDHAMFDERRVAQMAAFLVSKVNSKQMPFLKLMKLLYLADRESLARYGFPISFDRLVAMPNGPVLSQTLNYATGLLASGSGGWDSWIEDKEKHQVSLKRAVARKSLDELSDADIEVLEHVWKQFGKMGKWQLRDWTHENCAEWVDPNGSSIRIQYFKVFRALGKSPDEALKLHTELKEHDRVNRIFSRL